MVLIMPNLDIKEMVNQQLRNIFMYSGDVGPYLAPTLERTKNCFQHYLNKYYVGEGEVFFSPYHSGQYSIFLYYLANTVWRESGDAALSSVIYYLNKSLNAVDWYYEVDLPDIFAVEHPIGSVMGRGVYSNNFLFYQGCTVGGSIKGGRISYPRIGQYVTMFANSSILGDCTIGNHVVVGAGTIIKNQNIPDFTIVFGKSPNLIIKKKSRKDMKNSAQNYWG